MLLIWYGPFARLADSWHGWRDGRNGIPERPAPRGRADGGEVRVLRPTTPQREYLIRMANDAFEHERLRLYALRAEAEIVAAQAEQRLQRREESVARAAAALVEAKLPLTPEEESVRHHPIEDRLPEIGVRRRRQLGWLKNVRSFERRLRKATEERDAEEERLAGAARLAEQHQAAVQARVVRIQEHFQRRIAAYRRRLVRSHPDSAWVNTALGVGDPAMPTWLPDGVPEDVHTHHEVEEQPPPPPLPELDRIELGQRTVFGSGEVADVKLPESMAAPEHFRLVRDGDAFVLIYHGKGGRGPFIDGREVSRRQALRAGDSFDFGRDRFTITEDGRYVVRTRLGPFELVVADVWAPKNFRETGARTRIHGLSLVQSQDTLMAILGPSGAGKTSLFHALMRELEVTADSSLYFAGLNVATHGDQVRTMLGFVPQEDDLHQTLTVRQLLTYTDSVRRPWIHSRKRREDIEEHCENLKIRERLDQLVATLSGGQKKRVSIAMEVIAQPMLLMLDEPTSSLDTGMDRSVMDWLRKYADDGHLVIVITHKMEHLNRAHQVLVLAGAGKAVYSGSSGRVLDALAQESYPALMETLSSDADAAAVDRLAEEYSLGEMVRRARETAQARRAGDTGNPKPRKIQHRTPLQRLPRQIPVLLWRQAMLVLTRGRSKNRWDEKSLWTRAKRWFATLLPLIVAVGGALIAAGIAKPEGLGTNDQGVGFSANGTLSILITLSMMAGQALTYGDIVNEFPIIKREFRTGTVAAAVVISKWLVFAVLAVLQAALITLVFLRIRGGPEHSVWFSPNVELFINLAAMSVASMTLGMLISTMAKKIDQAVNWQTFIAIGQIALNGTAAELTGFSIQSAIAWLLPARWGLAAAASSIDIKAVNPNAFDDPLWDHTRTQWLMDLGILGVLTAAFFAFTIYLLTRKLGRPM